MKAHAGSSPSNRRPEGDGLTRLIDGPLEAGETRAFPMLFANPSAVMQPETATPGWARWPRPGLGRRRRRAAPGPWLRPQLGDMRLETVERLLAALDGLDLPDDIVPCRGVSTGCAGEAGLAGLLDEGDPYLEWPGLPGSP